MLVTCGKGELNQIKSNHHHTMALSKSGISCKQIQVLFGQAFTTSNFDNVDATSLHNNETDNNMTLKQVFVYACFKYTKQLNLVFHIHILRYYN